MVLALVLLISLHRSDLAFYQSQTLPFPCISHSVWKKSYHCTGYNAAGTVCTTCWAANRPFLFMLDNGAKGCGQFDISVVATYKVSVMALDSNGKAILVPATCSSSGRTRTL